MSPDAPFLSVVVPCYNEEAVLPAMHERLSRACAGLNLPYEIVLVNDGSRDRTWALMEEIAARDPRAVCVNLSRNHGHQLALTAGLSVCRGERVLVIDADLQDPPEALPEMMALMDGGADVVYGQRVRREGESWFKRLTAAAFYRLMERLTECPIPRDTGDFRLMSRRVLDGLLAMPERNRFIRGMVSWLGFRQVPYRYERQPRQAGESHYPLRKMVRFAWDAVTGFSVKPLALAMALALLTGLAALGLLGYAGWSWLAGGGVPAAVVLGGAVALLASLQFLVLGIMGEYLGRVYSEIKGRPLFLIDRILRAGETAITAPSRKRRDAA